MITTTRPTAKSAIEILSHRGYREGQRLHIVGEVCNNSSTAVGSIKIVATVYDRKGAVMTVGMGQVLLDSLDAGQCAPFLVVATHCKGTYSYQLQAEVHPLA